MKPAVPYYPQWESADRVPDILSGALALEDDPLWAQSGAASPQEYARWASHICGMACLKMLLAARTGTVHPTLVLTRMAVEAGAYVVEGDAIRGLIYAPCVEMLKARFDIDARVVTGITARELAALLAPGALFMASVHPSIREAQPPPPKKGGHLVLVTQADAQALTFHNPSGHRPATQRDVRMGVDDFDAYFAGRGILVLP